MEIKNFSDLTTFIYDEQAKMQESLGIQQASTDFCTFVQDTLKKYAKVYDEPFYKEEKRKAKLMEALNTRPHGWIWKLFHSRLWAKIQEIEKQEKLDKERQEKLAELDYERLKKELSQPTAPTPPPGAVLVPTWIEDNARTQIAQSES